MTSITTQLSQKVFKNIHTNNLIYNTCWEDPRCDRELLELRPDSRLVMITSAGCNALDYSLDNPAEIHCVDMNPRQNALLELKLSTFKNGQYDDLFALFGDGAHRSATALYKDALRHTLPDFAQNYWDSKINYFVGKGIRKTFYYHGTSGLFAWLFNKYSKIQKSNRKQIEKLINAQTLDEQQEIYNAVEKKILNNIMKWTLNRHIVMCLLGVPESQQKLLGTEGVAGFIQSCLRNVFTQLPMEDNYFWRLYIDGKYSQTCCPNYLKPDNFDIIKQQTHKITTHNTTISDFLKRNPAPYSHYVLLDHQDWLAQHNRPALEEEWRLILQNSRPGTRILMRSAAREIDFFPETVLNNIIFEKEKTVKTHSVDRVGTYGSVYLGIVK
jgi:S-adenosylmethionine-diacylglycerol 3-amino-3-carboxypropyl transferase